MFPLQNSSNVIWLPAAYCWGDLVSAVALHPLDRGERIVYDKCTCGTVIDWEGGPDVVADGKAVAAI